MKAQKNDMTTYDCHPIKAEYDHLRLTADHCRKLTPFCFKKEARKFMKKTVANLVTLTLNKTTLKAV